MSHFTVLVVGDNIEGQLEPYSENREVEPYLDEHDGSDTLAQALEWLLKEYTEEEKASMGTDRRDKAMRERYADRKVTDLTDDEKLELLGWYSGGTWKIEGGVPVRYTTYNPDSKWDWYQIGGRWRGFFKLKPTANGLLTAPHWGESLNGETPEDKTGWADQARKGDIDFDGMRQDAEDKARQSWAEFIAATHGIQPPSGGWKEALDRHGVANIDAARAEYNGHPWVQATRKIAFMEDPYVLYRQADADPEAAYIARAKATAVQTYAMVHEGQWIAKGEMGWFGMSDDAMDAPDFAVKQWELIESLPDDTLLTLIDCHI